MWILSVLRTFRAKCRFAFLVACILFVCSAGFLFSVQNGDWLRESPFAKHNSRSLKSSASSGELEDAVKHMLSRLEKQFYTETDLRRLSENLAAQVTKYVLEKMNEAHLATPYGACWNADRAKHTKSISNLPVIYIVTPTYRRSEQIPELTRFAQTLLNVPAIHWLVVEDANTTSPAITQLLLRYGIPFTHLNAQMPEKYQNAKVKPRGVSNRNAALEWVRQNAQSGVVYFADDDNSYDIRLFEEMRYTQKVSMWPVGLVTKVALSTPVVKDGKVVDFFDGWIVNRKFPVDMAGFAVSVQLIKKNSDISMPYVPGYEEDGFLKNLGITKDDIEPKAENCTKILVWHTQTKKNSPANKTMAAGDKYRGTNIELLQNLII